MKAPLYAKEPFPPERPQRAGQDARAVLRAADKDLAEMLSQFRTLAKSPIATVLMGLLVASFAVWGIRDVFRSAGTKDAVIQAGSRTVDSQKFRKTVEGWLAQYQQKTGQTASLQDALKAGLDRQLADGLATEEAFAAYVGRIGIRPSDAMVAKALQQFTAFFNPVSGQFDRTAYLTKLRENNLKPQDFEGGLRDDIAQQQFATGIAAALRAPRIYAAIPAVFEAEGRTFSWFTVGPQAIGAPPKPTDADLTALMNEMGPQLKRPEARVLSIVHFSAAQIAPTLPVDPAAVQKRYEFEKDTLSQPEKRTVIQIPLKDAKSGDAVAARLRKGEDPAAVARSIGVQPVAYADTAKGAIPDRKVADAAFALQPNQVSGVIQGDLGASVVKVTKITPGHTVTFEEARPKIEAEVRKAAAEQKIYQQVQKYEDARSGGSNLAQAAKAVGVTPVTLPPVTAKGTDLQGHPANLPPKLLETAFSLQPGSDSEAQDLGNGEYFAVSVDKVLPPSLPPLAQIRPQLAQFWTMREEAKRLKAKADDLAAQVRQGKSLDAVAASIHATPGNAVGIRRGQAGQTFSADLLGRLFQTHKPGDVVVGQDPKFGFVVAKLQAVVQGDPTEIARNVAAQQDNASRGYLNDLGEAVRKAARDVIKPKIDYKRARAALGGEQGSGAAQ